MRFITIMGQSGSGKTTLMQSVLAMLRVDQTEYFGQFKRLKYHGFAPSNVYVLGNYATDSQYAGLDRMPRDIAREAKEFISRLSYVDPRSTREVTVVFEGIHLGNGTFYDYCRAYGPLTIYQTQTDPQTLLERQAQRGNQSTFWQRRVASQVNNLAARFQFISLAGTTLAQLERNAAVLYTDILNVSTVAQRTPDQIDTAGTTANLPGNTAGSQ